jgi:hypothetical protein
MYRGYQTYRHFLNAKLHALSAIICGDDTVLREALRSYNVASVTALDHRQALELYRQLKEAAKQIAPKTDELKSAIGLGKMTSAQRSLIIKLTKYKFKWSPEATFSYILTMFPEHRKRMSIWEVQNSQLGKLYSMLSSRDADRVIKRLLSIEKRNTLANDKSERVE